MGLGRLFKKLRMVVDPERMMHTFSPRNLWSSGARNRTNQEWRELLGQKLGGMVSSLNPLSITGEIANPDSDMGESRKSGLIKLAELIAMAATAGGYGPFAGAGTAGATTAASTTAVPTLSTASSTMLPSATGVAYGSFSAPAEFSAGIPYNRIPIEMAYHAPAGGFLDAVGNIPVGRSNLSKLWQAKSTVGAIGRPILRQEQANRLSDLQNEQIKMYLLKLAMAKKKPYQMSQPIYEQRNLWA